MPAGRLTAVGTGIRAGHQVTPEARGRIEHADRVFYLATEQATVGRIEALNPKSTPLAPLYDSQKPRAQTYNEWVEMILGSVRRGQDVCAAFYGHPGVLVDASHESIRRARLEGFDAKMLPGISAEDCLFADLGLDPGAQGCQSYRANDFLLRPRQFDCQTPLVLWQITAIGETTMPKAPNKRGIRVLAKKLMHHYGPGHPVIIYEAAVYAWADAIVRRVRLAELPTADVPLLATLYVPALSAPELDKDLAEELGLDSMAAV